MGSFNPSDVGNSSKEGSSFTTAATLKQTLTQAPNLRSPDPEKAFQLYVHEREGIALGVLTQRLGSETQPVVYLSKRLDPNAQGWPPCLWNLATIAILREDALKLSFGGKLTIFVSHQVKQLLNGRGHLWMSDQRILRYQVVLMENPGLTIPPCEVLNPATILPNTEGSLPFHSCLETFGPLDKIPRGIVGRSSDQPWGNLLDWWKQLCLGMKKKSQKCSSLQFWGHGG